MVSPRCRHFDISVSHSLKKGQGAGQKKGTFDARNSPKRALFVITDRALGNAELRVLVRTFFPWDA